MKTFGGVFMEHLAAVSGVDMERVKAMFAAIAAVVGPAPGLWHQPVPEGCEDRALAELLKCELGGPTVRRMVRYLRGETH
jgi:hypothetical protein